MTNGELSREDIVLVAGATGGVGQLVVSKLLEKGLSVRILTRNANKAEKMFNQKVEIAVGDIREPNTLPAAMSNITSIICCTGTTAFPSARWEFDSPPNIIEWGLALFDPQSIASKAKNTPAKVDSQAIKNLVAAAPKNLNRFVFVSSCGILRKKEFPFNLLNRFGVLDAKQEGEETIIHSGIPYTIIRPGRLIDGPYTSYDLNTLTKATTAGKLGVVLGKGDTLSGEASRIDVAAACVESLFYPSSIGQVFELVNQGTRPPVIDWQQLFSQLINT
ncbi:SDR family oxidoreductase [Sphaerospermopsis aphanizomenoides BCCUSP55]|uniref:SDR family oxidoreductase n=1 Tax=Sphaerospermopsis aphanizomenoides TaxID=459663 RepID=UPI000B2873C0|nr:SDR family oxidoreductase [Sphaerospermopsis aphanizomenoides]MBK1988835.1 SDR family oxidoreductase [Sphaerospermopsis aphanizomenoides BCCUSP55]